VITWLCACCTSSRTQLVLQSKLQVWHKIWYSRCRIHPSRTNKLLLPLMHIANVEPFKTLDTTFIRKCPACSRGALSFCIATPVPCSLHCSRHAELHMLIGGGHPHTTGTPRPVIMWRPCFWPLKKATDLGQGQQVHNGGGGGGAAVPITVQGTDGLHQLVCKWDTCLNAHCNYYTSTHSPRAIPKWDSFEQVSYYEHIADF
jgi:hypothetical protein